MNIFSQKFPALALLLMLLLTSGCARLPNPFRQPTPVPVVPDAVTLQIDGSQRFQRIDGLGVNINGATWDNGKIAPVLDTLSNQLGATLFRVVIDEGDWEQTNDNDDPRDFNWNYYRPMYSSGKFASLWETLRYLEQKPDTQVALSIMGQVTDWMGRSQIKPEAEDEWVEMIASLVVYGRQEQGLKLAILSPINEVDQGPPEGPKVDPTQYARLMSKLVERLDSLGLADTRLMAPDIALTTNVQQYMEPLLADKRVMDQLAMVAFHNYGGGIETIKPFLAASSHPNVNFWLTEYSQWCEACAKDPSASAQWSLAFESTDFLLHFLEQGAAGALIYEGFDSYYIHHGEYQYWGILDHPQQSDTYTPRPRFYTAAQVFRFLRPGMEQIAVESPAPDLRVLVFHDPASDNVTIVGHNPTAHPVAFSAIFNELPITGDLKLTQTSQEEQLVPGASVTLSGNTLNTQIAPNSVFAISSVAP